MSDILNLFSRIGKSKFFRHGVPAFLIIIGGSFMLREFSSIRYQYSNTNTVSPEEIEKLTGKAMKKRGEVTMENEFEKIATMDIDNWENIRGPRPWEGETMKQIPK